MFDIPTLKKRKRAAADYKEQNGEYPTASTSASNIVQVDPWIAIEFYVVLIFQICTGYYIDKLLIGAFCVSILSYFA